MISGAVRLVLRRRDGERHVPASAPPSRERLNTIRRRAAVVERSLPPLARSRRRERVQADRRAARGDSTKSAASVVGGGVRARGRARGLRPHRRTSATTYVQLARVRLWEGRLRAARRARGSLGAELVARSPSARAEPALPHPHELADERVGLGGHDDACPAGSFTSTSSRGLGAREDLAPDVAAGRVAPARLLGGAHERAGRAAPRARSGSRG